MVMLAEGKRLDSLRAVARPTTPPPIMMIRLELTSLLSCPETCAKLTKAPAVHKPAGEAAQVSNPMPLGFEKPVLRPCPVGTCENSPAFQRWGWVLLWMRPVGTPEKRLVRPSLRDSDMYGCDPSPECFRGWAIFIHPSGMQSHKSQWHWVGTLRHVASLDEGEK